SRGNPTDKEHQMKRHAPSGSRRRRQGLPGATVDGAMSTNGRGNGAGRPELSELAALADGSLSPERRSALEAEVAASPELAALVAEQERAVSLTRSVAETVEAPASLRAEIERRRSAPRARNP